MGRHGDLKNRKSLRYAGLHHSTLRAYRRALKAILAYANKSSVKMFRSSQLDVSVSSYLDHCYQEGEPLSYAGHLLSALKRFHPSLKFKLPESSQFYKNWTKTYHPTRAIPASWEFTEGLMGYALCDRQENLGLLIGLGFIGMLRTAEMLALLSALGCAPRPGYCQYGDPYLQDILRESPGYPSVGPPNGEYDFAAAWEPPQATALAKIWSGLP